MAHSIKTRFVLVAGLLAAASIVAVALALRQSTRQQFLKFQAMERRETAQAHHRESARIAALLDGRCCDASVVAQATATLPSGLGVIIIDDTGALRAQGGPGMQGITGLSTSLNGAVLTLGGERQEGALVERFELHIDGMSAPLTLADGTPARATVLRVPASGEHSPGEDRAADFLGSVDRAILWATVLCGLAGIGSTWLLARRMLGPVDDLRAAARAIAAGDLTHRAPDTAGDELGDLARAFNTMAASLERQESLRRSMLHDVAHELRTPLTALRCRLETLVDGMSIDPTQALAGANSEVVHLGHLVDDLQELALAEAGELRLDIGDVDVATVVTSAASAAGLARDTRLRIEVAAGAVARADGVRLRQILLNLLTNADRHTPAGHTICVRARTAEGRTTIEVANTGSALDEQQRARVFDRFYRTDAARQRATGGTGLGLAIVKSLAEAQGGRVEAEMRGDELVFRVALPARA